MMRWPMNCARNKNVRVWNRQQEPPPNKEKADMGFAMPANAEPEMFAGA